MVPSPPSPQPSPGGRGSLKLAPLPPRGEAPEQAGDGFLPLQLAPMPSAPEGRFFSDNTNSDVLRLWIAIDEQWVLQTFGLDYRRRCVAGWAKMAAVWGRLADAHYA
jgi:hypothetical protein